MCQCGPLREHDSTVHCRHLPVSARLTRRLTTCSV